MVSGSWIWSSEKEGAKSIFEGLHYILHCVMLNCFIHLLS